MISFSKEFKVGCGDNSCVWGSPGGMATNGGCRCFDGLDINARQARRMEVHSLRASADAQIQILSALRTLVRASLDQAAKVADGAPPDCRGDEIAAAIRRLK